jgi:hypothetical protein
MKIRQGFHRLGMVGLAPFALAAGCAFLFAAYMFRAGGPTSVYTVVGPDGRRWEFKNDITGDVSYSSMEQGLAQVYGKPMSFGSGGVGWPTRTHSRSEAQAPAWVGLALLALGGVWYGLCWALGWVIAGFRGSDD